MVNLRWPDGKVACPVCGSEKACYLAKNRVWKCYAAHPKPRFTLKTGTIFEDSPIPLEKWLPAVWMILNCKNGVSSWELHSAIGVTQKTAWFMVHRIRLAMQDKTFNKLGAPGGEVEVDETFIGGKARNMHVDKREEKIGGSSTGGKEIVFGMVDRGGTVRPIHTNGATTMNCSGTFGRMWNPVARSLVMSWILTPDSLRSSSTSLSTTPLLTWMATSIRIRWKTSGHS
jgi:transposase-like protein